MKFFRVVSRGANWAGKSAWYLDTPRNRTQVISRWGSHYFVETTVVVDPMNQRRYLAGAV